MSWKDGLELIWRLRGEGVKVFEAEKRDQRTSTDREPQLRAKWILSGFGASNS